MGVVGRSSGLSITAPFVGDFPPVDAALSNAVNVLGER